MISTLAKARALIEAHGKATPGPWRHKPYPNERWTVTHPRDQWNSDFVASTRTLHSGNMQWEPHETAAVANADFIVTARNDSPAVAEALVEAVELLKHAASIMDGEEYHRSAAIVRAFLAKHGEGG